MHDMGSVRLGPGASPLRLAPCLDDPSPPPPRRHVQSHKVVATPMATLALHQVGPGDLRPRLLRIQPSPLQPPPRTRLDPRRGLAPADPGRAA